MPERVPIAETAPYAPVNAYGESKVMVEKLLHWFDQIHGLRSICLRYFNAAGADPAGRAGESHEPETHLIPLLFRAIRTGVPVTLLRRRLRHSGRNLHSRLHPRNRPGWRAYAGRRSAFGGESVEKIQRGNRTRILRARGPDGGAGRYGERGAAPDRATARGRSTDAGCGFREIAGGFGVGPEVLRYQDNCRNRVAMGSGGTARVGVPPAKEDELVFFRFLMDRVFGLGSSRYAVCSFGC
jgi:hypothetical protein